MKAFLAAVVVAIGLSYGAAVVLDRNYQTSVHSAFTTEGARVSHPGTNLIAN
jgi:hypothetical protein